MGENGAAAKSPDAKNWLSSNPYRAEQSVWNDVTFGNGMFVAVGSGIVTSKDGLTWEQHTFSGSFPLIGVANGNGTFVAVGGMYSFGDPQTGYIRWRTVHTSPNGRQWTQRVGTRDIRLQRMASCSSRRTVNPGSAIPTRVQDTALFLAAEFFW